MPRKNSNAFFEPGQETAADNIMLLEADAQTLLPLDLTDPDAATEGSDSMLDEDVPNSADDGEPAEAQDTVLYDSAHAPQDMSDLEQQDSLPTEDSVTEYGGLSVPLNGERRLDEELAALEDDISSGQSGPETAVDPPAGKPKKKPASRRKKAAAQDTDVEDSGAADEAVDLNSLAKFDSDAQEQPAEKPKKESASRRKKAAAQDTAAEDSGAVDEAVALNILAEVGSDVEEQPEEKTAARPARKSRRASSSHSADTQPATSFFQTNFNRLDRDLTEEERQEWNAIYASFRSKSILTGVVSGVDQNELPVRGENGQTEMRVISSLVVIDYRVKVLIPETAVWMRGEERSAFLLRGMIGATVDYVITNVDREGEVALASRSLALVKRRRASISGRGGKPGDLATCSVLVVGARRCLLHCGGYDVSMRQPDMSYSSILDMRELYRPGQELRARILEHEPAENQLKLSVREATPNPFDGAERRHPVGSRRQAVITGKYAGGVFCTLQDGTLCLCLYSNSHYDSDFLLGDNVIVHITQFDYRKKHIYGRIVSKW